MNKNKELVKNTAIISIGKFCTQFLSFVLLPLYTAILSTSEFGTVDLLTTYQQLIGYVVFLQMEQALFRFLIDVRGKTSEIKETLSSIIIFAVGQCVVLALIFGIVSMFYQYQYMVYLFANVISVVFCAFMLQFARGIGDNFAYALGSFISAISTIILNILLLVVFHMGVEGMMLSIFIGNLLCGVYIFIKDKCYSYISVKSFKSSKIKEVLAYSIPLVPNVISWWIIIASNRSIVSYFLGNASNGILSVSNKFSSAYITFFSVFNLSWTESASVHINDDDREKFFTNVISTVYRLFFSAVVLIIAILPFIFPIIVNSNYSDAYYQIPIFMVAALFNVVQGLYSVIYVALKKTKEIAKTTVVSAVINIIINIALIGKIGLYAATISSLVAYAINAIWRYYDLKRYLNIPFERRLLVSSIIITLLVCSTYYSRNIILEFVGLGVAVAYCVYENWAIIKVIIRSPKSLMSYLTGKKKTSG